jgi:putative glycosyltransferase
MKLSIVTTMYYSAPYIEEFYTRIRSEANRITSDFEIIFVNDGSPDQSLDIAISLYEQDEQVRIIDLSRNFGHHKAMMAGLDHASGDLVFLLDCDLEEKPELLGTFYEQLIQTGADVVYGVQQRRKGSFFERISGDIFFMIFNLLSTSPIPDNVTTVRLMSQRYVKSLLLHQERETIISGLWVITGYSQLALPIHKHNKGKSTYSLRRKIAHLVNSITAFSNKPLLFIFYLGCCILLFSTMAAGYLAIRRIFFGVLLEGWPSVIVSIWMIGGLTIFSLGVIGIYLAKIFIEVKQRPYTIIRQHYDHSAARESFAMLDTHLEKARGNDI